MAKYVNQPSREEIAQIAGIPPEDVIRFDHNTSPFHPDWAVPLATEQTHWLNEYPGADYLPLRQAAAAFVGLDLDYIVTGAGIDELILMAAQALLEPGQRSVAVTPTYPLQRVAALNRRANLNEISLAGPDFEPDPGVLLDAARDADLLWLTVPANPVGNRMPNELIEAAIAATDGVVVIDAAYAEIAGDNWTPWVLDNHNVVVLRTLSKAFNLAGARIGYAMGHPSLVQRLDAVRAPGGISSLSAALGVAALGDRPAMDQTVTALVASRHQLAIDLDGLGWRVLPSHTNFVLCEVGAAAYDIADTTLNRGMIMRTFPDGPLIDYIRVSVRSPEENSKLLSVLRDS
ncbi:MAG: histidinol-phosphate aminotransferase family protein [Acidimicrobiia bacterium]|nr:histidinol-phosphate aminotransferase family protein [Acidimicrobiia bacterium]